MGARAGWIGVPQGMWAYMGDMFAYMGFFFLWHSQSVQLSAQTQQDPKFVV